MENRKPFSRELAFVFAILFLQLGTSLSAKADLGISMIVAPAYVLHLKLHTYFSFATFGFLQYTVQALLLIALCILSRKVKLNWVLSFVTAFIGGNVLDLYVRLLGPLPAEFL